MTLKKFIRILNEGHEILFEYSGSEFLVSTFYKKSFFKKISIEYWFSPPKNSIYELQKFTDLNKLLNISIFDKKIIDIIDEIKIIEIY